MISSVMHVLDEGRGASSWEASLRHQHKFRACQATRAAPPEGRVAVHHLVQNAAQAPDVRRAAHLQAGLDCEVGASRCCLAQAWRQPGAAPQTGAIQTANKLQGCPADTGPAAHLHGRPATDVVLAAQDGLGAHVVERADLALPRNGGGVCSRGGGGPTTFTAQLLRASAQVQRLGARIAA